MSPHSALARQCRRLPNREQKVDRRSHFVPSRKTTDEYNPVGGVAHAPSGSSEIGASLRFGAATSLPPWSAATRRRFQSGDMSPHSALARQCHHLPNRAQKADCRSHFVPPRKITDEYNPVGGVAHAPKQSTVENQKFHANSELRSLVTQRLDRIERRGFPRRIKPKGDPNKRADA